MNCSPLWIPQFVALAPNRFGLANRVLAAAMVDLFAFGTYFLLSLCAFAMLFFVQLGSRMLGFRSLGVDGVSSHFLP